MSPSPSPASLPPPTPLLKGKRKREDTSDNLENGNAPRDAPFADHKVIAGVVVKDKKQKACLNCRRSKVSFDILSLHCLALTLAMFPTAEMCHGTERELMCTMLSTQRGMPIQDACSRMRS